MKFSRNFSQILILVAVLFVLFGLGPRVYTNMSFFFDLLFFLSLCLSFNIIYGYTGYLPFGFSAFVGVGAYAFGVSMVAGYGVVVALLMTVILSVAFALVLSPTLRLRSHYFSISSLAALEGTYYLVSNNRLTNLTGGPYGLELPLKGYSSVEVYASAFALLLSAIVINYAIKQSRIGLTLRAIKDDPVSASLSGVNVVFFRDFAWIVSSVLAGLAGGLFAWNTVFFYPEAVFSIITSLFVITFSIFGGVGTVIGPVVGTAVLYTVYNFAGILNPTYAQLAFGVILILSIMFLPNGITGLLQRFGKQKLI